MRARRRPRPEVRELALGRLARPEFEQSDRALAMEAAQARRAGVDVPAATLFVVVLAVAVSEEQEVPLPRRFVREAMDDRDPVPLDIERDHLREEGGCARDVVVPAHGGHGGDGRERIEHALADIARVDDVAAPRKRCKDVATNVPMGVRDKSDKHASTMQPALDRPQPGRAGAVNVHPGPSPGPSGKCRIGVPLAYTRGMAVATGVMKAREFISACEEMAVAALPPGSTPPGRTVMWTMLQLHWGNPDVHVELQTQGARGLVELGLHFEGPAEENEAGARFLAARADELRWALGDEWELEEWTASWRRLHRTFAFETLTRDLAHDVAVELAKAVEVFAPLVAELPFGTTAREKPVRQSAPGEGHWRRRHRPGRG